MSYKVSTADLSNLRLNETDTVTSVLQNVAIILATRRGTCPLYRGFGLSQEYLDRPIPVARSMMYADIRETVEKYEPRAEVVNVSFDVDADQPGRLMPTVEVNIVSE